MNREQEGFANTSTWNKINQTKKWLTEDKKNAWHKYNLSLRYCNVEYFCDITNEF